MVDFVYKKYTTEEDKIYEQAMLRLKNAVHEGMTYDEACAHLNIKDQSLLTFIMEDFLKIMIAEMHYEKGMSLKEIADKLAVPHKQLIKTKEIMLEDIAITAAAEYHKETSMGQG
ncbi:MAG: hypothetical protein L3V56_07895 [Candidatus Magnetoovum sp. WYHC-5]|nr:hypothetical protein [Candidatus Magnetoovum sp. WYHC-5]